MWRSINQRRRVSSRRGDVPDLVEERADLVPGGLVDQQVVPLGDDQRSVGGHGHGAGDGLLDVAPELGRVDDPFGAIAQPAEQRDVAEGVERVDRALAILAAEPGELDLGQVEPVHPDESRLSVELRDDALGERRLAAAGGSTDAEQSPDAGGGEPPGAGDRLVDRQQTLGRAGLHGVVVALRRGD